MRHGRHGPHLPFIAPLQIINFSAFASEFFGYSRLTLAHAGCTLDDERCANARSPSNRSSRAADASKTLWRACYGTGWRWRGSSLWLRSRSTWKRLNDPGPSEWSRTVIIIDGMSTTSTCGHDLDEKTDTLDREFIDTQERTFWKWRVAWIYGEHSRQPTSFEGWTQAGSQRHPTDVKSRQRSLRWGAPYPTYGEQSVFYGSYLDLFTLGCSGNHGYCRPWYYDSNTASYLFVVG